MSRGDPVQGIDSGDLEQLNEILESLLQEVNARCAVLLDRAGRLLTIAGDARGFDGTAFASLAAADFAAGDQLAGLLGEQEFTSLYHQGETYSMYLVDVGGWAILAALFDDRATLGMVRLKTREVLPKFSALFAERAGAAELGAQRLEPDWAQEAEDEIDRLFKD